MDTKNRPERDKFDTWLEYKRALEHYIYWLGQERIAMDMRIKDEQKTGGPKLGGLNLLSCPFCPFCGFDKVTVNRVACWAEAQCDTCGARSGVCESEDAAAEAWSIRAADSEKFKVRQAAEGLIEYVLSCRRKNQPGWMDRLCHRINTLAVALGDCQRAVTHNDGLQVITPEDETR